MSKKENEEAARQDYLSLFASAPEAQEFEERALSVGREYLPRHARRVALGGDPTPAYWRWLASQVEVLE